jgi:hypothetical protein
MLSTLMILTLAKCLAASSQPPKFDDFPADVSPRAPYVSPLISSPFQKRFRTQIIRQSHRPANFAGHFRVAEWGCGSSCVQIAIIDLDTGRVSDGPFKILSYGIPYSYEGGDDQLEYRRESRLLIARGCPSDRDCGTHYYEWRDRSFIEVRFVPSGPVSDRH